MMRFAMIRCGRVIPVVVSTIVASYVRRRARLALGLVKIVCTIFVAPVVRALGWVVERVAIAAVCGVVLVQLVIMIRLFLVGV